MDSRENVRLATAEDVKAIYNLTCDLAGALGETPPEFEAVRKTLLKLLREPAARVLVAEEGGEVAGAVSLWIKPDLAHGDVVVEVPMLVVASGARRQGIGKMLMSEIQNISAGYNAALIELVVADDNDTARAFYHSIGFVETDHTLMEFIGDLQDPPDPEE